MDGSSVFSANRINPTGCFPPVYEVSESIFLDRFKRKLIKITPEKNG
jgi:hypothetical protein